jgi:ribonuclease VapC
LRALSNPRGAKAFEFADEISLLDSDVDLTAGADGDIFADALSAAETRLTAPIAVWEAVAGLVKEYPLSVREARAKVADFLAIAGINTVALGSSELAVAIDAYDQFGKGRHPARLNMGDCFAHAAARCNGASMLHNDAGFYLTDISSALDNR